jgi:hypothetical protein
MIMRQDLRIDIHMLFDADGDPSADKRPAREFG